MNRIREFRERQGLSQQEIAERLGVHATTVAAWERAERNAKRGSRLKLARVLGCTIYDLYPSEEIPVDKNPLDQLALPSPHAKYQGQLRLGEKNVDCYVLDTGDRVISLGAAVQALSGSKHGNLSSYLETKALSGLIDVDRIMETTVDFYVPITGFQQNGKGITAETFIEVCDAYVTAFEQNLLTTDRQREIAVQASMILRACAKVGIIALIDEATGYQYERAEDALQLKLRAFISEEMRDWEKTFPDELWEELGRLAGWNQPLHLRPKWWGKLVMELIYDALDPDVADYLRTHKPPPIHRRNYHQWLSENYGLKQLITHLNQVIGIAKTCNDIPELRQKVGHIYRKVPMQLILYTRLPSSDD